MGSPDTITSSSSSSSSDSVNSLYAVRMPIEEPVSDVDEAVRKLKKCTSAELRRTRRHHLRALEALEDGGYNALSPKTRARISERLRRNLEALEKALETSETKTSPRVDSTTDEKNSSSRFWRFLNDLW